MTQENFHLLSRINVVCQDDGDRFTRTDRRDVIREILSGSAYHLLAGEPLFDLYGKKPLDALPDSLVLISTHIDCVEEITCFSTRRLPDGLLRGTFDNSLTNMAAVRLMLDGQLPENAVIAFTGNEEDDSLGAVAVSKYLEKAGKELFVMVLDVTDMGYDEGKWFTVENNFWENQTAGASIVSASERVTANWGFVPSDSNEIPACIPGEKVIRNARGVPFEAECDESWEYDEQNEECFSLCIPVSGPMHSNAGVLAREESVDAYIRALKEIAGALSNNL